MNLILLRNPRKVVSFACKHQQESGAWAYSPLPCHQWVDNFHTGYNLECLYTYQLVSGDKTFRQNLEKGTDYYLNTFFQDSGLPKYYNNNRYPIHMHTTAQLIVTLSKLNLMGENKKLADKGPCLEFR